MIDLSSLNGSLGAALGEFGLSPDADATLTSLVDGGFLTAADNGADLIGGFNLDVSNGSWAATQSFNVTGSDGNDSISTVPDPGTELDDDFVANLGNHTISTGAGNDHVLTGAGDDEIHGGDGDDVINAGDGDNKVWGDQGFNDILTGDGNDEIHGGDDIDTISSNGGNDVVEAGGGDDVIQAGDGNDEIHGGDGNDEIQGQAGDDVIWADEGDDENVQGGSGADEIHGGAGNDNLFGETDNDQLYGEDGEDSLFGDGGDDELYGGAMNDTLHGGTNADFLVGGQGNDTLFGGDGSAQGDGARDVFSFSGGDGFDQIWDFETGIDQIDVRSFGFASFDDINIFNEFEDPNHPEEGGAAVVELGGPGPDGAQVMIVGLLADDLSASDFILV